jgi:hypothetical protein
LQSEEEKTIKEMGDKKDAGNDDVPENTRKSLRKNGLRLMTKLVNNIPVTGHSSKDFIYVTATALRKKPEDSE